MTDIGSFKNGEEIKRQDAKRMAMATASPLLQGPAEVTNRYNRHDRCLTCGMPTGLEYDGSNNTGNGDAIRTTSQLFHVDDGPRR